MCSWLANNKLTGRIPDLGLMKSLRSLHLENNQFEGAIPLSLGMLPNITEMLASKSEGPERRQYSKSRIELLHCSMSNSIRAVFKEIQYPKDTIRYLLCCFNVLRNFTLSFSREDILWSKES
ncbi:hypothetical protein V2J09_016612 [Rumex salicifolius]